jgi:FtsH-binding integral membrane protein
MKENPFLLSLSTDKLTSDFKTILFKSYKLLTLCFIFLGLTIFGLNTLVPELVMSNNIFVIVGLFIFQLVLIKFISYKRDDIGEGIPIKNHISNKYKLLSLGLFCLIDAFLLAPIILKTSAAVLISTLVYTVLTVVVVNVYAIFTKKDTRNWLYFILPVLLLVIVSMIINIIFIQSTIFGILINVIIIILMSISSINTINMIKHDLEDGYLSVEKPNGYHIDVALTLFLEIINIFLSYLSINKSKE